MKRAYLLLTGALLLGACTPAAWRNDEAPVVTVPAQAADGTSVRLTQGAAYQTVVSLNGDVPSTSSTLTLFGKALRVNDRRCAASGFQVVCEFGPLLSGGKRTVYATGVQVARFTVTRQDGSTTVETH